MIIVTDEAVNASRLRLLKQGRDVYQELVRREKEIEHFVSLFPTLKRYFEEDREPDKGICQHGNPIEEYCDECEA